MLIWTGALALMFWLPPLMAAAAVHPGHSHFPLRHLQERWLLAVHVPALLAAVAEQHADFGILPPALLTAGCPLTAVICLPRPAVYHHALSFGGADHQAPPQAGRLKVAHEER